MSNQSYRFAVATTLSLAVAGVLCLSTPARAQSTAVPDNRAADNRPIPDNDSRRTELAQFNQFLDGHPEIAEQLRRNPSLADDRQFVDNHPALRTFMDGNPGVRDQLRQDPNAFMRQENNFDPREDARDRDINRRNLADFDRFLDGHREIAEQVRRNPSLVDNRDFVQNHPALQDYLQSNPGVRDQLRQDPNAFMREEDRFDHPDDARHERMADFGEFLGGHARIAEDVSKNPTIVNDREYVQNHRDLNEYLNAHPEVKQEWASNPQGFVKGAQQFTNGNMAGSTAPTHPSINGATSPSGSTTRTPTPDPINPNKPKQ
jgi:hypothetical protein